MRKSTASPRSISAARSCAAALHELADVGAGAEAVAVAGEHDAGERRLRVLRSDRRLDAVELLDGGARQRVHAALIEGRPSAMPFS